MTKAEKFRLQKQGIEDTFHELDKKSENDTRLVDKVTRPLFR